MINFWINLSNSLSFTQSPVVNAIIIFLCGFLLSIWLKQICLSFLNKIHLHEVLEQIGFKQLIDNIKIEKFIGFLCQVFLILFFAILASETLQFHSLSNLLSKIVLYYPNIFISIIIFIISIFGIDFFQKLVVGTKTPDKITYSRYLTKIVDWSIRVLMVLAILYQLQIVPQLIVVLFAGVVLAISLFIGISFGLAGKEPMSHLLKEIKDTFKFF